MKYIINFLLILLPILSLSQEIYPKEVTIGSDTVICITENQLKEINAVFEENKAYRTIIDSTDTVISSINGNILLQQENLQDYVKLTTLLKEQLNDTNKKVDNAEQNIKVLQEQLKQQRGKTIKLAIGSSVVSFTVFTTLYLILK